MKYQLTDEEFSSLYLSRSQATSNGLPSPTGQIEQPGRFKLSMHTDYLPMGTINLVSGSFEQDVLVKDVLAHSHVGLHFQLTGYGGGRFSGLDTPTRVKAGQHNIFYHSQPCGDLHFSAQQAYQYMVIMLQPDWLKNKLETYPLLHEDFLGKLHQQRTCTAQSANGLITPALHDALTSVTKLNFTGPLRQLYLEAKVLELLTLQLEQPAQNHSQRFLTPHDTEALHAVRSFLDTHFQEPGTLHDIAIRFGLNEFKLKKGFKQLFATTVWEYVVDRRLYRAHELLAARAHNVNEAALLVGYESVPHFISVFKRKFGVSPGQLARRP